MKERGVIFRGEEVRATLDGRMTQFRRPVKNIRVAEDGRIYVYKNRAMNVGYVGNAPGEFPMKPVIDYYSPYGRVGDRLYVRETFWHYTHFDMPDRIAYDADTDYSRLTDRGFPIQRVPLGLWEVKKRPSIHMPRWAARIFLEITSVRVERLQDISEEDVLAEGTPGAWIIGEDDFQYKENPNKCHRFFFSRLWNSLARPGERWGDNPWVWVNEFKVVTHAD
jgi:hypothetical protein